MNFGHAEHRWYEFLSQEMSYRARSRIIKCGYLLIPHDHWFKLEQRRQITYQSEVKVVDSVARLFSGSSQARETERYYSIAVAPNTQKTCAAYAYTMKINTGQLAFEKLIAFVLLHGIQHQTSLLSKGPFCNSAKFSIHAYYLGEYTPI